MTEAEQIRNRIRQTRDVYIFQNVETTRGQKGALVGYFNKLFGDQIRYLVWSWLLRDDLDPLHAKDMTDADWHALLNWVEFGKIDGQTVHGDLFEKEHLLVMNAALKEFVEADWSTQVLYALDPLDYTPTAVMLGGEVVEVTDDPDTAAQAERTDRPSLPLIAKTRYGELLSKNRRARQSTILRELGYDDVDDPVINF